MPSEKCFWSILAHLKFLSFLLIFTFYYLKIQDSQNFNSSIIIRRASSFQSKPRVEYTFISFYSSNVIACLLSSRRTGAFSASEIHCESPAPMELTSFPFSGSLVLLKTTQPRSCVDVDVRTGSYIRVDRFRSLARVALLDAVHPYTPPPFIVVDIHSWRKEGSVICHVARKDWT